ncbi:MAG: DNA-deoxyinosine glycosylase [Oscillospiraceae bacterium]|nr:DNA-deoxyinosine glycosylase [Oscillospiraceae bacterium]
MSSERVSHEFPPVFDENSKVLILGSIPSPKSREQGFYYMHPQNRFWKMLCNVLGEDIPADTDGRRKLCLSHGIALWDVLESCDISGASDSSIKNAVPNDLDRIFRTADIRAVFTTGKTAHKLYQRFFEGNGHEAVCLPSTSPANRTITEEAMLTEYRRIGEYLNK